jgi:phosphoglycerol transferase MdoB-like AlkP superfamily enzyme
MQIVWRKCKQIIVGLQYILPISLSFWLVFIILRVIFYFFNRPLFTFASTDTFLYFIKAAILSDANSILPITFLFGFLYALSFYKFISKTIFWLTVVYFSLALCLNFLDVFYFSFTNQKANADLLYAVNSPLQKLQKINPLYTIACSLVLLLFIWFSKYWVAKSAKKITQTPRYIIAITAALILAGYGFCFNIKRFKLILPYYGLTNLSADAVVVAQNSMHTFAASLIRGGQALPNANYFSQQVADSIFLNQVKVAPANLLPQKNIVLFIMESVPYDFFDSTSTYKVAMPFFDTLVKKATFFTNAFCYTHISNKGIVATLAGMPTLTEIPLYHTSYINMPLPKVGKILQQKNYTSFFCIGDGYDDFGFAKCTNMLGFNNYYCRNDLPNEKQLPSHSMGVHDEFVLDFMYQKINQIKTPFFATNFNISTHYYYDLPKTFSQNFPANYTAAMRAMAYYDKCVADFFKKAKTQPWFNNTIFIFTPDHWMYPNDKKMQQHVVNNYRVPIIIYDPSAAQQKIETQVTSPFGIVPTILSLANCNTTINCFGNNLLNAKQPGFAVTKIKEQWYQIVDSTCALGFNASTQKSIYLYDYKKDTNATKNIIGLAEYQTKKQFLENKIKAFLQQAVKQYTTKK